MLGHASDIEKAIETLSAQVTEQLSVSGWTRRWLAEPLHATLTRPTHNGVLAVLDIDRTWYRLPDGWPVEIGARLGAGYEPALNLMPLLTLEPHAELVVDRDSERDHSFAVELDGPTSVALVAGRIVQFVERNISAAMRNFPDAEAIDAQLQREIEAERAPVDPNGEDDEEGDEDLGAYDYVTKRRLLVLAAMGRHQDARDLLATFPANLTDGLVDRDDRRFVRQLGRWLEAGGPAAPPVEQTLAQLPRRTPSPRPSWSDARAKTQARQAAHAAVRAQSAGKTQTQLAELITTEYAARGIDLAPSAVQFKVNRLLTERRPFGRFRNALEAVRTLTSVGTNLIDTIRHDAARDPAWLLPPDRASYPLIAAPRRHTAVIIDADAQDWLERIRTEAPRRLGPRILVDVWLSQDERDAPLIVHVGDRRLGTVTDSDAIYYDEAFRAAALFDEDPLTQGRLLPGGQDAADVFEIPLSEDHAP